MSLSAGVLTCLYGEPSFAPEQECETGLEQLSALNGFLTVSKWAGGQEGGVGKTFVFDMQVFKMLVLFHEVLKDKLDTNKSNYFYFTVHLDCSK